ncbi:HHL237Wp [Eremothecium sinecaudum]|uniref:HHL237Wp n=1 Tax=Eremothecium sinecaudum TaxID=45286 RepID=A0A120K2T2_9SACH|nr:HHL237Wp [Eremothecium sinecaudum]AMD22533.1 HHL237Wp [Eremothecium sinecaudum]
MSTAEDFKKEGNNAFVAKDFQKAVELFTKAIEASTEPNHVLYSNRSASHASLKNFKEALADAEECVKINPSWSKGHNRLGAALYGLGKYDEAEKSYQKALDLDASNKAAKDGLDQVRATMQQRSQPDLGLGSMFQDPNLIQKLKTNPKTAEMMKDPQLVSKVLQFQANPQAMGTQLLQDPRMMTIMAVMLGVDLTMGGDESSSAPKEASSDKAQAAPESSKKESAPSKEPEPEPMEVDDDKRKAEELKTEGNALYKKRNFDEAIEKYDQAWNLHKDVTFLNNRAAAEYEKGDYESAIKTLEKSIEEGRELRTDYKIIAKSFSRMGAAYHKLGDCKKAIEYYEKSLTEHRTPDALTKLRNLEKELKKKEAEAYIDPEKAEEARLQGKEYFSNSDWPNAVKAYTEMIKRAPHDARGYSNRAAALAKLMSFPEAIKDCNQAIEKDPNFIRAYIRKANAQIAVKEYSGAIETLETARTKDAETNNGANAREIDQLYFKASQQRFKPANANETPEEAYARAMKDPEVAAILQDPVMQSILAQAQQNPAALEEHMKNPAVFKKIQTLIAAGVIRTR